MYIIQFIKNSGLLILLFNVINDHVKSYIRYPDKDIQYINKL